MSQPPDDVPDFFGSGGADPFAQNNPSAAPAAAQQPSSSPFGAAPAPDAAPPAPTPFGQLPQQGGSAPSSGAPPAPTPFGQQQPAPASTPFGQQPPDPNNYAGTPFGQGTTTGGGSMPSSTQAGGPTSGEPGGFPASSIMQSDDPVFAGSGIGSGSWTDSASQNQATKPPVIEHGHLSADDGSGQDILAQKPRLSLYTRFQMFWDPLLVFKRILYTKPSFRNPQALPNDFLQTKMVKLRLHRVDKVQESKTAQQAKQSTRPFIRVHVLDLQNGGKWLQKPPGMEVFTYPCRQVSSGAGGSSSSGSAVKPRPQRTTPAASPAGTAESGGGGDLKDGGPPVPPPDLYLPANDEQPLSAASQRQVTFVRPFDTPDCPGIQSRSKKNAFNFNNKRSWDFVFQCPANYLVNPNVLIVLEILEKPKTSSKAGGASRGPVTKMSWGYLRLDQLYANGVDLPWELNTSPFTATGASGLGVFSQITSPVNPRFNGVWLQLHEYKYTKEKAHVCEDLQTPMVFHELQDLRKIKRSCLLVSAQLIPAVQSSFFQQVISDSRSARADLAAGYGTAVERSAVDQDEMASEAEEMTLYRQSQILQSQRTKIPLPEDFAYQLPSDGRGCHRVCFSPKTSRFLACAVELNDETFELRVFDLAKAQVHCVCQGHRELVYDLSWVTLPSTSGGASAGGGPSQGGDGGAGGGAQPGSTSNLPGQQDSGGPSSRASLKAPAPDQNTDDLPGQLVSASSDGTVMVFEIPEEREWRTAIAASETLYHPSYCYTVRPFDTASTVDRFFLLVGGHTFGLKVWKIDRRNLNQPIGDGGRETVQSTTEEGGGQGGDQEPVPEDWRIVQSQIVGEFVMDDRSHITCLRFSQGSKQDLVYTAHSVGYITAWRCSVGGGAGPASAGGPGGEGIRLEKVGIYKSSEMLGLFFYNIEIVTEQLQIGKVFGGATLTNADDWVVLNAKDNLIRLCALQNNSVRVFTEISGTSNSKFPIRSTIAPDGKTIVSGCESGRLFFFNTASGKHVVDWEAQIPVQLSSPIVDVQWSRTHHLLAFSAFGDEEPPILVYRHVNAAGAGTSGGGGGQAQLKAPMSTHHHDMHNASLGDWSSKWMSHGHPTGGVLGHDKKGDLKMQILAQVMDSRKHAQILEGVEKSKNG
ncbi:unnamed protein product [Amoebophrya sp. A120]|nr:unnamed protein product [Amoebophrya sp. A120]|eukprot:GSA120T00000758001.1